MVPYRFNRQGLLDINPEPDNFEAANHGQTFRSTFGRKAFGSFESED